MSPRVGWQTLIPLTIRNIIQPTIKHCRIAASRTSLRHTTLHQWIVQQEDKWVSVEAVKQWSVQQGIPVDTVRQTNKQSRQSRLLSNQHHWQNCLNHLLCKWNIIQPTVKHCQIAASGTSLRHTTLHQLTTQQGDKWVPVEVVKQWSVQQGHCTASCADGATKTIGNLTLISFCWSTRFYAGRWATITTGKVAILHKPLHSPNDNTFVASIRWKQPAPYDQPSPLAMFSSSHLRGGRGCGEHCGWQKKIVHPGLCLSPQKLASRVINESQ